MISGTERGIPIDVARFGVWIVVFRHWLLLRL